MAAHAGAKITNNNLSFTYDLSNGKSFKGKPTTNLLLSSTQNHTGGMGSYWYGVISTNNFEKGFPSFKVTTVDDANNKSDGFITSNGGNLTDGTTYTWSADVWIPTGKSVMLRIRNISGGYFRSGSNVTVNGSSSWVRVSRTFTADTNTAGRIEGQSQDPASDVYSFWVKNLQIEENDFATPFVAGTRSNTQAILDLTGNQTVTAESLTYSSSDTTFGANSDYVTIGDFDDLFGSGSINATLEFWIKPPTTTNRIFVGRFPPSVSDHRFYIGSYGNEWDLGWGAYAWNNGHSGTRPTRDGNQWQQIVVSISSGVASFYKNGVLGFTKTDTSVSQGAVPFTIGAYFNTGGGIDTNYHSAEDIDVVRVYNRALSATEINQNFNALRRRFGL